MQFSKVLKTKTFKVNQHSINKVKLQLLPVEVRVNFMNNKEHIGGYDFRLMAGVNNAEFIREMLSKKIGKETTDEIVSFLSQNYKLDLSKVSLL